MHTTNYFNTFIASAEDCPVEEAEVPPVKGDNRSAANIQFDMIIDHPYKYTSDDVVFGVFAEKNKAGKGAREEFFSKGQPCLRASPLVKRYGWGVHSNADGKVAIYGKGTPEYKKFEADKSLKQLKGMRSKKA